MNQLHPVNLVTIGYLLWLLRVYVTTISFILVGSRLLWIHASASGKSSGLHISIERFVMKIVSIMVISTLFLSLSFAAASPRVGQRSMGICTSDFNLWGNASQCSCEHEEVYDERSGFCLASGEAEEITVQGAISSDVAAIGGETTGFLIKTFAEKSYELILKVADQERVKERDGPWFEVSGEHIIIESVEMKQRHAIIVDTLSILEKVQIRE